MIRANVGHAAFARLRPPAPAISREAGDCFRTEESAAEALRPGGGRGAALDFRDFPMVAFWTKPGGPFLCMEPWHGCAAYENETGRFQDKPHVLTLAPGEKKELAYAFTLPDN